MHWNLDGKIPHSFNNSFLSILSAFLREIEALLFPKKNFLLKYASHKYKMRNKGSKNSSLYKKISNTLMLKMCLSGCSFCALLATLSFSPTTQNTGCREPFRSTNAFTTSTIFKLSVLFCGHEGPSIGSVGSEKWQNGGMFLPASWYVFTRFFSSRHDKENFFRHNGLGTKVFVVALNNCTNSTSSFALSKYLRASSCAFN